MFIKLRAHLAHHVIGYLALFVALGGTASALAANTVGTLQLRPFAVRNSDIGTLAVSSSKLANDSVGSRNLRGPVIREGSIAVPNGASVAQQAFCARGELVIGGGTRWLTDRGRLYDGPGASIGYTRLVPLAGADGVRARGNNASGTPLRLVVQALCMGV